MENWIDAAKNVTEDSKTATVEPEELLALFQMDKEWYALKVKDIQEVVRVPGLTPIPQAPAHIKGVANIRGDVLAMVDLEAYFGLQDSDKPFVIVLNSEEFRAGLMVQKVPETLRVPQSQIDTSTSALGNLPLDDQFIIGILHLKDRMVVCLDLFQLLEKN